MAVQPSLCQTWLETPKTGYLNAANIVILLYFQAALAALTEDLDATSVQRGHFTKALNSVKPSLNEQLVQQYSNMKLSTFKNAKIKR